VLLKDLCWFSSSHLDYLGSTHGRSLGFGSPLCIRGGIKRVGSLGCFYVLASVALSASQSIFTVGGKLWRRIELGAVSVK